MTHSIYTTFNAKKLIIFQKDLLLALKDNFLSGFSLQILDYLNFICVFYDQLKNLKEFVYLEYNGIRQIEKFKWFCIEIL